MWSSVKRFTSPDGKHELLLDNFGEVPFGPPYFALSLRGGRVPSRFFGDVALWSDDSHLVAVQEWLSLDIAGGPQTKLVLIDAVALKETDIVVVDGGFVRPTAFNLGKIASTADYFAQGRQGSFEHEIPGERAWRALLP